jgi:hypothetical protein
MKQTRRALAAIASVMFGAHIVDVWWMIAPTFYPHGIHLSWLDFAALLGVGGVWFFFFIRNLKGKPLVPMNDPRFAVATSV